MRDVPAAHAGLERQIMPTPTVSDEDLMRLFLEFGCAETSKRTGLSQRNIYSRRRYIEGKWAQPIKSPHPTRASERSADHPGRIECEIKDGYVVIGSDCHYWPGPPSLMHRALVKLVKDLKPPIVILNGDVIDACSISRHPPIGWENMPKVQEEIEAAQDRLHEIEMAAGKARKIWTLGNHDSRFETRLQTVAPEFAKVKGLHLKDHFPLWEPCWSVFINDDVVVKHRFKGGIHAVHNNALWAGKSMVTGHLHSSKVTPLTDYNGTRYGVDAGCVANPNHKAFLDYTEDNPKNWRDGFVVLKFNGGQLMPPQLVTRWDDNSVVYCNEILKV